MCYGAIVTIYILNINLTFHSLFFLHLLWITQKFTKKELWITKWESNWFKVDTQFNHAMGSIASTIEQSMPSTILFFFFCPSNIIIKLFCVPCFSCVFMFRFCCGSNEKRVADKRMLVWLCIVLYFLCVFSITYSRLVCVCARACLVRQTQFSNVGQLVSDDDNSGCW